MTDELHIDRRNTHFAQVPHWVADECSSHAYKLYGVLMRYADNQSRTAYPSRARLAEHMGFNSVRTVDRYLDELEAAGALQVVHRDHQSNVYVMQDGVTISRGTAKSNTEGSNLATSSVDDCEGGSNLTTENVRQIAPELYPSIYNQELESASPASRPGAGYTDEFEEAWKLYPRHDDKKAAFRAYKAARKTVAAEVILAGVRRYRSADPQRELRFTKLFSTWLNAGSWDNNVVPIGARYGAATLAPAQANNGMRLGLDYDNLVAGNGNTASASTR